MSINGTTGTTVTQTPTTGNTGLGTTQTSSGTDPLLDKNAFLNLMMVQLQNQDPLDPSQDPSQYMSQLAQLTSVEQMTNVAQSTSQAAQEQNANTALQLLGHTVTYLDSNGNSVSGTVQKVDFTSSGPSLTISGVSGIDPTAVNEVS